MPRKTTSRTRTARLTKARKGKKPATRNDLLAVIETLEASNKELQSRVDELMLANRDIETLMENAQVGIIFLDPQLCIRRFTQASKPLVELTSADIGRPFKEVAHELRCERLLQDVQATLETRSVGELEVPGEGGASYLLRIMPYRTRDELIGGVVLTITDVTARKRAEIMLQHERNRLGAILETVGDPIFVKDNDHRILLANRAFYNIFGLDEAAVIGKTLAEHVPENERVHFLAVDRKVLDTGEPDLREETLTVGGLTRTIITKKTRFVEDLGAKFLVGSIHDITDRKRVEDSLRESEARFAAAFSDNPVPLSLTAHDGTRVDVNKSFCELLGYSRQELIGKKSPDPLIIVSPRDPRDLHEIVDSASSLRDVELEIYTKSGEARDILMSTKSIFLKGEKHLIKTLIDITQQNRARRELVASEEKFANIFRCSPAMMAISNATTGRVVDVNQRQIAISGYSREEWLEKMPAEFGMIPPEVRRQLLRELQAQGRIEAREITVRAKAGRLVPLIYNGFFMEVNGERHIVSIAQDISALKQAEHALRESEVRTQTILDTMLDGGQIIGRDWRYLYLNDAVMAQSGYQRREDLLGFTIMEKYPGIENTELFAILRRCMAERISHRMETRFVFPDGTEKWFQATIQPVPDGLFILSFDITERKRMAAEHQAREMQTVEDQRLQSLGLLTGGVAHDINNLLTPIWTNIELLRVTYGDKPETNELFEAIITATQRSRDLVRQMLAFAGRHPMSLAQVDLNELIADNQTLLRASLPKNVLIQLELAAEPLPLVADRTQLQQVVMNLIINAMDAFAGKAGEIFVSTRLQPSTLASSGAEVVLIVRDTGPGILPENLPRIFDPFFTTKSMGHGLGLSATRGIVRTHRGHLEVQSVVGEGTTFTIRLPVDTLPAPPTDSRPSIGPMAQPAQQGLWLVIDDERLVRKSTCRVLKVLELRTLEADDGASGLALAREHAGELTGVVLDLTMPGMSGREVFQRLRAEHPALPVLLLSGYSEQEVQDLVMLPKVAFVAKPYSMQTVRQVIQSLS